MTPHETTTRGNPTQLTQQAEPPKLHTVAQFAKLFPAFSQPSLRNLILNSANRVNSRGERIPGNGLEEAGAIVRIGRRVLIDQAAFFRWIAAQQKSRRSA